MIYFIIGLIVCADVAMFIHFWYQSEVIDYIENECTDEQSEVNIEFINQLLKSKT